MIGIILAAGKSKRMGLPYSKVLLTLNGRPVLSWVIDIAKKAKLNPVIVVVSPSGIEIQKQFSDNNIHFVIQSEAKGTADAVRVCDVLLSTNDDIFILYGDIPLLKITTVVNLIDIFYKEEADVALLTAIMDDPAAYGRIVRNEYNEIKAIIEYKDANQEIRRIKEINTGVYVFRYIKLKPILETLKPSPVNGEYYLTTAVTEIIKQGGKISSVITDTPDESFGINTPEDLEKVKQSLTIS
jgi:bifunctional N-acetylglucosamine-1-phosphate-uridyltransferase/glucosamine-1-phosphate-acetyltransferase GlmU-like protein